MSIIDQGASSEAKMGLPPVRPAIDSEHIDSPTLHAKRSKVPHVGNASVGNQGQVYEVDLTDPDVVAIAITEPTDLRLVRWSDVMPTVSLVIPARNEASNLHHVLKKIPHWVSEVILVDGASSDGTIDVAQAHCPGIKVIRQHGLGKGNALIEGFQAAKGDIIAVIDADGSMDATELHAMVGQLMCGADLVKGSRFLQGGGSTDIEWYRRAGNLGLVWLTRLLYGARYSDLCYGYLAFWRQALDSLAPDTPGFEIEALINVRALKGRMKVVEVASFESPRIHGESQLKTFHDGSRILRTILAERSKLLRWLKVSG